MARESFSLAGEMTKAKTFEERFQHVIKVNLWIKKTPTHKHN